MINPCASDIDGHSGIKRFGRTPIYRQVDRNHLFFFVLLSSMLSLCAILFLLEALATLASGLYIPIQRRSHFYFSSGSPGANPYGIKNHGNMGYTGTVSVNGHPFEVSVISRFRNGIISW